MVSSPCTLLLEADLSARCSLPGGQPGLGRVPGHRTADSRQQSCSPGTGCAGSRFLSVFLLLSQPVERRFACHHSQVPRLLLRWLNCTAALSVKASQCWEVTSSLAEPKAPCKPVPRSRGCLCSYHNSPGPLKAPVRPVREHAGRLRGLGRHGGAWPVSLLVQSLLPRSQVQ